MLVASFCVNYRAMCATIINDLCPSQPRLSQTAPPALPDAAPNPSHLLQVELVVLVDACHGCEGVPRAVAHEDVRQICRHLDQRRALACPKEDTPTYTTGHTAKHIHHSCLREPRFCPRLAMFSAAAVAGSADTHECQTAGSPGKQLQQVKPYTEVTSLSWDQHYANSPVAYPAGPDACTAQQASCCTASAVLPHAHTYPASHTARLQPQRSITDTNTNISHSQHGMTQPPLQATACWLTRACTAAQSPRM